MSLTTSMRPLGNLPEADQQRMVEIGKGWSLDIHGNVGKVIDIYLPLLEAAPATTATVHADVSYGAHPRQVMDIFEPRRQPDGRPADVMLFLHGGAFVRGAKCVNEQVYANVCRWFADRGMLTANVEYRLAPESPWPGGARDVAEAVEFMTQQAAKYGGNPARIFLVGHSAGGTHVATYAYDHHAGENGRTLMADAVRGVVLLSSRLRADVRSTNPNAAAVRAYFGDDETRHDARSPLTQAAGSLVPTCIVVGEYENPHLDYYGVELLHELMSARDALPEADRPPVPRFIQMLKHNHISIAAHFNSGEEFLGQEMLDFFARC